MSGQQRAHPLCVMSNNNKFVFNELNPTSSLNNTPTLLGSLTKWIKNCVSVPLNDKHHNEHSHPQQCYPQWFFNEKIKQSSIWEYLLSLNCVFSRYQGNWWISYSNQNLYDNTVATNVSLLLSFTKKDHHKSIIIWDFSVVSLRQDETLQHYHNETIPILFMNYQSCKSNTNF